MQDSLVPQWGQCGGVYYTGSTTCVTGFTCVPQPGNIYFSQCLPNVPSTPPTNSPVTSPTVSELYSVATYEGYGYLLPLVISDYLRKDFIAASAVNQFVPIKQFANILVNAQSNLDTLYQPAWLDLTQGPQVVSVPDSKGRYYVLPIYDLWTEVLGVPGPRTTGGGAFTFVITPPNWTGTLPSGLWEIRATTFYIYILGRIYTTGTPADIAATNAFQDAFSINSLSNYINNIPPTVVTNTGIVQPFATASIQKAVALSADQLFAQAAELLKIHPPHSTDFSIIARLRRIGFLLGQSFNFGSLDPVLQSYILSSKTRQFTDYANVFPYIAARVNGWALYNQTVGNWGNFYFKRWPIAVYGYAANPVEDTIYPSSIVDNLGAKLDAQYSYTVTFAANALPPAIGFWSVTLYSSVTLEGIPNSYNKYRVSPVDNLVYNSDGSLTIYVQNAPPKASVPLANWLPVGIASGGIKLLIRLYWPQQSLFEGTWVPPPIVRTAPF